MPKLCFKDWLNKYLYDRHEKSNPNWPKGSIPGLSPHNSKSSMLKVFS